MNVCFTTALFDFALVLTLVVTWAINLPIMEFLSEVMLADTSVQAFIYMALLLIVGLPVLFYVNASGHYSTMVVRKLFHVFAFVLFTPQLLKLGQSKALTRMIVFAFNCVTAFLMLIEVFRCKCRTDNPKHLYESIANTLDRYFSSYCDDREGKERRTLILTHIYLLMGCALAPTTVYILVDGGFVPDEFCVVSLSGVVFLGIGDSVAALYGKAFGHSRWSRYGKKTTEGSWACIFAACAAFFVLLYAYENPYFRELFMAVAIASFVTGILEGITFQFDNLICPPIYFVAIL